MRSLLLLSLASALMLSTINPTFAAEAEAPPVAPDVAVVPKELATMEDMVLALNGMPLNASTLEVVNKSSNPKLFLQYLPQMLADLAIPYTEKLNNVVAQFLEAVIDPEHLPNHMSVVGEIIYFKYANSIDRARLLGQINIIYSSHEARTEIVECGLPLFKDCPRIDEAHEILYYLGLFLPEEITTIVANLQPVAAAYNGIEDWRPGDGRFSHVLYDIGMYKQGKNSRIANDEITFDEAVHQIRVAFEAYEGNKAPTTGEDSKLLTEYLKQKIVQFMKVPQA